MHLIVDAQALQAPGVRDRGIGRYTKNFVRALLANGDRCRVEVVVNAHLPPPGPAVFEPGVRVHRFEPLLRLEPSARDANERYFGDWLSALGADAIIEPNFFAEGGALVPQFTRPHPLIVGIAYDLIPLLFHRQYLAASHRIADYGARLRQFALADLILAISEGTRADVLGLMRWPASRVATIGGAAASSTPWAAAPEHASRTLRALRIDRPFILYVGGDDPRKNLAGTLVAFASLSPDIRRGHQLVIVCSLNGGQTAAVEREAERLGIQHDLRLTSFVDDDSLQTLYRSCRLMLFLSYYEGLGLPVLEALLSGAPVVASNRGAIPEFAGSVSRLVDPSSPTQIATAIEQTLQEPRDARLDARQRFAASFSWARTSERAIAAIRSAAAQRRATTDTDGRPRVAWVSPLPPTSSNVDSYAAALLSHLPADLDIELVVSPDATVEPHLASRFVVLRFGQVAERHHEAPFDLFVYHLKNTDEHVYVLEMMRQYSGLLSLHDLRLGRLALCARDVGRWPGDLAADLEREGATELAQAVRRGTVDRERIAGETALTRSLIDASEAVVVHDAESWTSVRQHATVPVLHIPHATGGNLRMAARAYAAAIHMTIARRRRRDGEWADGAGAALAAVDARIEIAEGALERWAQVRLAVGGRGAISEAR